MPELWISTQKTILAAALGTMGVVVRTERALDHQSGQTSRRFHLGETCIENKIRTNSLKQKFESGELLRDHPDHPILDICYAKQNRDRLLDAVNQGTRIQFVKQAGTDRTFYTRSEGTSFPGRSGVSELISTSDLNLVASLARFGVPVLEVDGPQGSRKFYLDARQRLTSPTRETALEIVQAWRAKKLSSEHPMSYAIMGLINYARLVRNMDAETEQVLIRKPNSRKSAIIDPNTTGKGMDRVRRFFLG